MSPHLLKSTTSCFIQPYDTMFFGLLTKLACDHPATFELLNTVYFFAVWFVESSHIVIVCLTLTQSFMIKWPPYILVVAIFILVRECVGFTAFGFFNFVNPTITIISPKTLKKVAGWTDRPDVFPALIKNKDQGRVVRSWVKLTQG